MRQILLMVTIVMLLSIVGAGFAEDNKPTNIVPLPQVKEVVVFKNGFAYVRCEGATKPIDGKIIVSEIPDASMGAFWGASLTKNVALESITARKVDVPYTQTASNIQDLIRLNADKTVTIVSSDAGAITGTLLGFQSPEPESAEKLETQDPNEFYRRYGYWPSSYPRRRPTGTAKPSMQWVFIKTNGKVLAVRINSIRTILIDNEIISTSETLTRQTKQLVLAFGGDAKALQQPINYTLFFIIKGIRWIPDYKIELTSSTEANLRMSATVLNEVLNIKDAPVRLMIGYPNFAFGNTVSPLTLRDSRQALSSFFRSPTGSPGQNYLSNAVMSQRAERAVDRMESLPQEMPQAAEGGVSIEDMFGYDIKNLTIAKGNVVLLPVMESKNPIEHLYELDSWSLRPITRHGNIPKEVLDRINMPDWDRVWHKLKIKNPNDAPLTTAPATIFEKGHPIAQEMIKYTPPKSETIMPITIAVDIPNDIKEIEAERKSNALKAMDRNWDLVTNKGSIVVTNKKGISITLKAKVHVLGKVTEISPDGKTEASPKGWDEFIQRLWQGRREHSYRNWWNYYGYYENINPISLITWDISLEAGESATLNYTYSYYDYR